VYFLLTDTCIGIIKSSGARKFCPNIKFSDKTSAGLTRLDCIGKHAYSPHKQIGIYLI